MADQKSGPKPLFVYVLFNHAKEPLAAGFLANGRKRLYNIYGQGCRTSLLEVEENKATIAKVITQAVANGIPVVTSDFKSILATFPIDKLQRVDYTVYDLCWETEGGNKGGKEAQAIIDKILDRMATVKYRPWQKVFANAAIVYQALEDRGVNIGMIPHKPIWAQNTYSGRSKNLVVNIQGADGTEYLTNPAGEEDDIFLYFDWMAADIRVAALLSGDPLLNEAFATSDPYTHLEEILTDETGTVARADCKIQLLQAINSFNFTHPVLESIYKDLGLWLQQSKRKLDEHGELKSILGRKFQVARARNKNPLAVQNGVLQGSVAHGMQHCVKRIWDTYGSQLLVEIHDSVALTCKPEYVNSTIKGVVGIMTRPFEDLLESNPFFPVKVSIGRQFRKWKPIRVYRESGMEKITNVAAYQEPEAPEEGPGEEADAGAPPAPDHAA